jgi:hypothetical protein
MWHGLAMRVRRVISSARSVRAATPQRGVPTLLDMDEHGLLVCARMDKDQVTDVLVDIGLLLELKDENPFKTRVCQNAARTLRQLNEPLLEGGGGVTATTGFEPQSIVPGFVCVARHAEAGR